MKQLDLFEDNFNPENFENHSIENGFTFWWASTLSDLLGYKNLESLQNAINKTITVFTNLGINIFENIIQVERIIDDKQVIDYKLSRFACYLIVMNANVKKQAVSLAQAYFASLAGAIQNYLTEIEQIERINIRGEISKHENSISATFKNAGGEKYYFFQNAGYRGMYNMNISKLRELRGIEDDKSPLDFMGSTELAANLFRITQTEERIKNQKIKGQKNLEQTHEQMGKMVRDTMIRMSGTVPENLPKKEDIKEVKKQLKQKNRELKKIDTKKKN